MQELNFRNTLLVNIQIILPFWILATLFSTFFYVHFKFPITHILVGVTIHVALVSAISLLYYHLVQVLLRFFSQENYQKFILGSSYLFLFWCIILIYIVAFLSKDNWGHFITFNLLHQILPFWKSMLSHLPFHLTGIFLLIFCLFLVSLFILIRILYFLNTVMATLQKQGLLQLILLIILVAPFGYIWTKYGNMEEETHWGPIRFVLHYDPISAFVFQGLQNELQLQKNVLPQKINTDNWLNFSYPSTSLTKPENVIIIMVDALRADHLPMYGYHRNTSPFLNQLYQKQRLTKVDYCTSTCSSSFCGILSMFNSKRWEALGLKNFGLQEALKINNYDINFILTGVHRGWYGLGNLYGHEIDYFFEGIDSKRYYFNDDNIIFEALENLKEQNSNPDLFYFHLMSTHELGVRRDTFQRYQPDQYQLLGNSTKKQIAYTNYYDNGIYQTDYIIKQIFEKLQQKGYMNDALVVILADHGEGLGENGVYGHTQNLSQSQTHIPLLLYSTHSSAIPRNIAYASHIDVAPTILDYLGLPIPDFWQGQTLLKDIPPRYTFHQQGDFKGIVYSDSTTLVKYVLDTKTQAENWRNLKYENQPIRDSIKNNLREKLHKNDEPIK